MRTTTVAGEIRGRVLGSREHFWRPEDFGGSPDAVAQALSRMERSGELRRVRRGLYWRGTTTLLGMEPPPADRLVGKLVGEPGTGPAGWSAALALGLSTQVPRHEVIAVPGRAPREARGIRFVSRASSTGRRDERLRQAEVALLEVLRDWDGLVEVPLAEGLERVSRLVSDGVVRLDRVVRASRTEPPAVRERLRRLLRDLNRASDADRVRPARSEFARHEPTAAV